MIHQKDTGIDNDVEGDDCTSIHSYFMGSWQGGIGPIACLLCFNILLDLEQ